MSAPPRPKPSISGEVTERLKLFDKKVERLQLLLVLERYRQKSKAFLARREQLRQKPNFWLTVLTSHDDVASHIQEDDMDALKYLDDVWISRCPAEPRVFSIELAFTENPFFRDSVLRKEFRHLESPESKREQLDSQGFKWAMLEFEWERDVAPQATYISWKRGQDLCRKNPPTERDGQMETLGSFFNWLQLAGDPFMLGVIIAEDVFPNAMTYYKGGMPEEEDEDEDITEGAQNDTTDPSNLQGSGPSAFIFTFALLLLVIRVMPY